MSKHMKRLVAPRRWGVPRKKSTWVTKPNPGPHAVQESVPLLMVVRDMLQLCDTGREARHLVSAREIMVDGRIVNDRKFPVGFMDVVTVSKTGDNYRMLIDTHGRFKMTPIAPEEAKSKLVRIEDKTVVPGGKFQLNLHDGRNMLLEKNKYGTGDVLKIELPTQKVLKHIALKEGVLVLLMGGSHPGALATVESFETKMGSGQNFVSFKEGFSTVQGHVFAVGAKSPEIKLLEVDAI